MKSAFSVAVVAALIAQATAQVAHWGQCGGNGYTGSTSCASGSTCVKSNDWYSQCIPSSNGGGSGVSSTSTRKTTSTKTTSTKTTSTKTTSTKTTSTKITSTPVQTGGNNSGSGGVTTTFPSPAGSTQHAKAVIVTGSFDGGMARHDRSSNLCTDSNNETGEDAAVFILENGATLSNVIIGKNQAEGVHCRGSCTLRNVWWEDVCEDAATFKQSGGTSYVIGGGAKGASDKIFQHNGGGTVNISNFYANNYGKVYRSCGNCKNNGMARHVVMNNIVATSGGVLAGINTNYGDTAKISNSCVSSNKICDRYTGNSSGKEPSKIGSGPDGTYCVSTNNRSNC